MNLGNFSQEISKIELNLWEGCCYLGCGDSGGSGVSEGGFAGQVSRRKRCR
jgi:hypothetical protein